MVADKIQLKVAYNGKDISEDISKYCIGVGYTDNVEGTSDTIELRLEDVDQYWKNGWYPEKGAELTVAIGKNNIFLDCGVFQIDQIRASGPPDTVILQGLGAGISGSIRTKTSASHANKTLSQIAQTIAKKNGWTIIDGAKKVTITTTNLTNEINQFTAVYTKIVSDLNSNTDFSLIKNNCQTTMTLTQLLSIKGLNEQADKIYHTALDTYQNPTKVNAFNLSLVIKSVIDYMKSINGKSVSSQGNAASAIINIVIERTTQNDETDLAFLNRISKEFGYIFSVRGKFLTFISIYEIEDLASKIEVDKTDLIDYDILDKTLKTYSKVEVKYHNPKNKTVSTYVETVKNKDGVPFTYIKTKDVLTIHTKAENEQQAKAKAQAAIYRANSLQQEGSFSTEGNPYLCAGNNFDLTGLGLFSGKYHIMNSKHNVDRSGAWTTSVEIKKVGFVVKEKQKSTKKRKPPKYTVSVIQ